MSSSPAAPVPPTVPAAPAAATAVLLVDDRPENLLALEAILAPLGVRLVRAGSADEALRHVLREPFAVILLDVQMPGTDGLATARLIKQRAKSEHIPIIFLTALDQDRRHATLGYESGAVDYLFKPLDPDVLRAKVQAFVELDRLRDQLAEQQGRRFADLAVRESEERFQLVQRATNDVIWDWDVVTGGLRWNEAAGRVFGAPPGELPDDVQWWFAHIHPDDRARVAADIHAVIDAAADTMWSAEYRFRLGDGSYRTFLDRGYVARDADGQPVRMIGAMQDVTARVRAREAAEAAQAAAERARADAEAASRLKSEFLATMSHEFRTPLNAILGYAQLLDMGVLGATTPAQHAHLERLQASARHLLGLVDDVLDVAKVDADRLAVRRDPLMTGAAVAAAVTLMQPLATAKGVRLLDLGAGEAGVPYVGDEHRVRQILVNLLSNAVKFTPAGGQSTVVCGRADEPDPGAWRPSVPAEAAGAADASGTSGPVAAPGGWAFVRVEDTGAGLAPDLLPRLFEPFVQGDGALTREQGGTGLGLAISRRLARLMGGDVTVHSPPGRGATFTLWLPDDGRQATDTATSAGPAPADGGAPRPTRARSTPALGALTVGGGAGEPLRAGAYAVLQALGARLAADAEAVADRYVAALRADPRFPGARELPTVQLRDHATPAVGLLATRLMIIGETRGRAPELLGDGAQLQRVMDELHGAQRHRLGWSEADLEREGPLFLAEVERAVRAAVEPGLGAGVAVARLAGTSPTGPSGVESAGDPGLEEAALRAAAAYAVDLARNMVAESARTCLRAHRFARAADAP